MQSKQKKGKWIISWSQTRKSEPFNKNKINVKIKENKVK